MDDLVKEMKGLKLQAKTLGAGTETQASGESGSGSDEKETPSGTSIDSKKSAVPKSKTASSGSSGNPKTSVSPVSASPASESPAPTEPFTPSSVKVPQATPKPQESTTPTTTPKVQEQTPPKATASSSKVAAREHAKEEFFETVESVLGLGSESDSEPDHYQPIDLIRIMIPVMLCMIFVVLMTILITDPDEKKHIRRPKMLLTPFDSPTDDTRTKAWETAANVGILISVIVVMTFLIVGLYWCYCYMFLLVLMAIPVIVVNLIFTWAYLNKIFHALNAPLDHVTAALLSVNFGTIGILSILGRTPKLLQQFYLLYLCGVMASLYISYMPDYTVWGFLAALAVWDLIAVLTPCGPLRILVETVQKRDHDFAPAMIYTTFVYTMASKKEERKKVKGKKGAKNKPKPGKDGKKEPVVEEEEGKKEERRLRLGLGDFVFYSLLIGKATEMSVRHLYVVEWTTVMACFVSIIVGLLATIVLLVLRKKALPALPISIALGLIFYFSTEYVVSKFCSMMSAQQVFL